MPAEHEFVQNNEFAAVHLRAHTRHKYFVRILFIVPVVRYSNQNAHSGSRQGSEGFPPVGREAAETRVHQLRIVRARTQAIVVTSKRGRGLALSR